MYCQYFGFHRKPFELTPDTEVLFLGESHREALSVLRYGVVGNKGYLLLTGGVGTGKTTLLQGLTAHIDCPYRCCMLSNPVMEVSDFYYYLGNKLELPFDGSKAKFLIRFGEYVANCRAEQSRILIVIDEAHALPLAIFDEIRFLSNLPPEDQAALSIFLVGQPELLDRLAEDRLLPLRQRIAIRYHIDPLPQQDARRYVLFRLERAGAGGRQIFTEKALERIYMETGGNPRLINVLSDNALFTAFAAGVPVVDEKIIASCAVELMLPGERKNGFFRSLRKKMAAWRFFTALML